MGKVRQSVRLDLTLQAMAQTPTALKEFTPDEVNQATRADPRCARVG